MSTTFGRLGRLAAVASLCVALLGGATGCGRRHGTTGVYVSVQPGDYTRFDLTLVNNTNRTLYPTIEAPPYDYHVPTSLSIPSGGVATVSLGYMPSRVTVSAYEYSLLGLIVYQYPTTSIYYGSDYYSDSTGATYYYR